MPVSPQQPLPLSAFYGPDGLRAGWSLLLYFAIAALSAITLDTLAHYSHLLDTFHQLPTAKEIALGESIGCISSLAAALLMSLIEQRPFFRFGLAPRHLLRHLLAGLFWGLALLAALIAALYLSHHLAFDRALLHGTPAVFRGLAWLLAFSLVALQEEFLTRGYIQFTLTRGLAGLIRVLSPGYRHPEALAFSLAALLFSGCFFMTGHLFNSGETPVGILATGLAGITLAFSLWRTGTLWWAIGFHAAWDWAQSFLFGVPDSGTLVANRLFVTHPLGAPLLSGGSNGPEGSLLVVPTLLLACLVIHLTLPRRSAA